MSPAEYTAMTAMLSTFKHQIAALETMLAAIANVKREKKSTASKPIDPADAYLSDDEEEAFQRTLERARQEELQRMEREASGYFVKTMQDVVNGSSDQNPA